MMRVRCSESRVPVSGLPGSCELQPQEGGFQEGAAAVEAVGRVGGGMRGEDAVAGVEEGQGIAGADAADGTGGTELPVTARFAVGNGKQGVHDAALKGRHPRREEQGKLKTAAFSPQILRQLSVGRGRQLFRGAAGDSGKLRGFCGDFRREEQAGDMPPVRREGKPQMRHGGGGQAAAKEVHGAAGGSRLLPLHDVAQEGKGGAEDKDQDERDEEVEVELQVAAAGGFPGLGPYVPPAVGLRGAPCLPAEGVEMQQTARTHGIRQSAVAGGDIPIIRQTGLADAVVVQRQLIRGNGVLQTVGGGFEEIETEGVVLLNAARAVQKHGAGFDGGSAVVHGSRLAVQGEGFGGFAFLFQQPCLVVQGIRHAAVHGLFQIRFRLGAVGGEAVSHAFEQGVRHQIGHLRVLGFIRQSFGAEVGGVFILGGADAAFVGFEELVDGGEAALVCGLLQVGNAGGGIRVCAEPVLLHIALPIEGVRISFCRFLLVEAIGAGVVEPRGVAVLGCGEEFAEQVGGGGVARVGGLGVPADGFGGVRRDAAVSGDVDLPEGADGGGVSFCGFGFQCVKEALRPDERGVAVARHLIAQVELAHGVGVSSVRFFPQFGEALLQLGVGAAVSGFLGGAEGQAEGAEAEEPCPQRGCGVCEKGKHLHGQGEGGR